MDDINKKNTSDQMRILLKRMRVGKDGNWQTESEQPMKKNLDMRDMLKITRKLNEENDRKIKINKRAQSDPKLEKEKFLNSVNSTPPEVTFEPIKLMVYDDYVFYGGLVNGIIQFAYKVTLDEDTSGVVFKYLTGFSPDNPDNDKIIKKIENYYDEFRSYWIENEIQN